MRAARSTATTGRFDAFTNAVRKDTIESFLAKDLGIWIESNNAHFSALSYPRGVAEPTRSFQ